MNYCRLTLGDRYQIEALDSRGVGVRGMARQLGRSPSCISRELKKKREGRYSAEAAQSVWDRQRHRVLPDRQKIRGEMERYVRDKIKADWSPEQIAGRRRILGQATISYSTIYRYIERDKRSKGELWKHLRILRRKHKNRKLDSWNRREFLPNRVPIEHRPKEVEKRERLGDYERDTVLGKRGRSVLLTIVDRTSRLLKLAWVQKSTAEAVHRSTLRLLKNEPCNTITNDNGFEFSFHHKTAKSLHVPIYFSRSYCAWERGTNENTNGLLRQYFPKKTDIGVQNRKQIAAIELKLNSRPRKTLGYKTPLEIHSLLRSQVLR